MNIAGIIIDACTNIDLLQLPTLNTLLKIFKGTLRILPLITIQMHAYTHSESWINKAKTCLSFD